MAFTIIGFSALQTVSELTALDGIPDQHIRVSGNDIYIGDLNHICMSYAIGANINDAQLSSPSLRRVALEDVVALEQSATPVDPPKINWKEDSPRGVESDEALNALTEDAGSGGQQTVIVGLSSGALTPVTGDIVTIEFTASIDATAYEWSNGAITFGQTLPVGTYQVVGADVIEADSIAFRFVPIGATHRPGGICRGSRGESVIAKQRRGQLGVWFEFSHLTPPTLDILCTATGTKSVDGFLDLIKIG